ncbi:MAG: hypothetical protein ACQETE_02500 [Bacteroidota bacterium]
MSLKEQLEEDFHAQPADSQPHEEELDFLSQRHELSASLPQTMTTEQFLERYDEIESYALTDEILKRVDADVWHKSHYKLKDFISGDFYRHFKHHWVIRQYVDPEYIEREYEL